MISAQLASVHIDDIDLFDDAGQALWAIQGHTCAAALYCTTHTATDEFYMPHMQDAVVSVCAENRLGVQTNRDLPFVRDVSRQNQNVTVTLVGTTTLKVVHAFLSDDLRPVVFSGQQPGPIGTIRIVPNVARRAAKPGVFQRLVPQLRDLFY